MSELKGKSVQVTNPVEYGMALASFVIAGANVWPWHKGYKPLGEEESHHTYVWEDCGFLKMAGIFESISGDYKSPTELIEAVKSEINNTITEQEKVIGELTAILERIINETERSFALDVSVYDDAVSLLAKHKQPKGE